MIKRFRGIAKELWEEECKTSEYVKDFREEKYFIDMINGTIEIINPYMVLETRSFDSTTHLSDRDNNYLRFVIDDDNIIDIPKENIIYIHTKYGEFMSQNEYLEKNSI